MAGVARGRLAGPDSGRAGRDRRAVDASGGGRRRLDGRTARGAHHRDGVGEVAGLPAARARRRRSGPGGRRTTTVRWRRRPATSLYLAPTKALAHDQARVVRRAGGARLAGRHRGRRHRPGRPAVGPGPRSSRAHQPGSAARLAAAEPHPRGRRSCAPCGIVVVDESHRYRGVFGAQVAAVLRRLRRIAAHYRADPTFAVLSATAAEPIAHRGRPDRDRGRRPDPGRRRRLGPGCGPDQSRPLGRSAPETAAAELMAARVRAGEQVLTFVPSRRLAEEVARSAEASSGPRSDIARAIDGWGRSGCAGGGRRACSRTGRAIWRATAG